MCSGCTYGWAAPFIPYLTAPDSPVPITNQQGSLLISTQEYGGIVGGITGAFIVNKIGRKYSILLATPIFAIGWLVMAQIVSFEVLLFARFMGGLASGLSYTVIPIYIGEISSPEIRGVLGCLFQIIFIIGLLSFNILGNLINVKVASYFGAVIPVVQLVSFIFMPESPYYLIKKNKLESAEAALHKLNNGKDVDVILKRIVEALKEEESVGKVSKLELFTDPVNRKAVFITFGVRFFQQATGFCAINFYVKNIFIEVDTGLSPSIISIVYFSLQLASCFINLGLIDKTGRKPLLIYSFLGTCLANLVSCVFFYLNTVIDFSETYYRFVPVITLLVFVIIFNVGLAATPMVLLGEYFNTRVKGMALALADMYCSVLIVIVVTFFQYTNDNVGLYVPFGVFMLFGLVGLAFVYYCMPETKGLTLEQIQMYLKGKSDVKLQKDSESCVK